MVSTNADHKTVRVFQLRMKDTPADTVRAKLEKQWGPGKASTSAKGNYLWDDPVAGWRVELEPSGSTSSKAVFYELMPFDKVLGADGKFDFEAKGPLFGMTEADLMAIPGAFKHDDTSISINHPATEVGSSSFGPQAAVKLDHGACSTRPAITNGDHRSCRGL